MFPAARYKKWLAVVDSVGRVSKKTVLGIEKIVRLLIRSGAGSIPSFARMFATVERPMLSGYYRVDHGT
jgi:hypothetical protein